MTDQVVIDYPDDITQEEYELLLNIAKRIKVKLWKSDERKTYELKWDGTRICCPVTTWWDFPDHINLTEELKDA